MAHVTYSEDENTRASYVSWSAILAGAILATAYSFVMLTFGAAAGLSLAISLLLAPAASGAEPARFELDPEHVSMGFLVEHLGYAKVLGLFRAVRGGYRFDDVHALDDVAEYRVTPPAVHRVLLRVETLVVDEIDEKLRVRRVRVVGPGHRDRAALVAHRVAGFVDDGGLVLAREGRRSVRMAVRDLDQLGPPMVVAMPFGRRHPRGLPQRRVAPVEPHLGHVGGGDRHRWHRARQALRLVDARVRFRGFTVPDRFYVGYGFDYRQRYRNLPDLHELELQHPGAGRGHSAAVLSVMSGGTKDSLEELERRGDVLRPGDDEWRRTDSGRARGGTGASANA